MRGLSQSAMTTVGSSKAICAAARVSSRLRTTARTSAARPSGATNRMMPPSVVRASTDDRQLGGRLSAIRSPVTASSVRIAWGVGRRGMAVWRSRGGLQCHTTCSDEQLASHRQVTYPGRTLVDLQVTAAVIHKHRTARPSRETPARRHEATRGGTGRLDRSTAHSPKVAGSNPAPATRPKARKH